MYKVSIIVPIFNVEEYIERCFDSISRQTYEDIECIFINDATPDDSATICSSLICKYKGSINFRMIHHSQNRGLSAARNTGINSATGDFLFFLDSDDEITADCISLLVAEAMKNDNIEMVTAAVKSIPYDSYYYLPCYKKGVSITNNADFKYQLFKPQNNFPITAWNKLIRTSFLKTNNLFFREGLVHEDELWTFLVSQKINHAIVIPQTTYVHYFTEKSIMTSVNQEKRSKNVLLILNLILDNIDSSPFFLQLLFYLKYMIKWYKYSTRNKYLPLFLRFAWKAYESKHRILALYLISFGIINPLFKNNNLEKKLNQYIDRLYQEEEKKIVQSNE